MSSKHLLCQVMQDREQNVEDTGLDSCPSVHEGPIYTYRRTQIAKAGPDSCGPMSTELLGIEYGSEQMKEVRFLWRSDH